MRLSHLPLIFALALVAVLLSAALFAPWLAPHDPNLISLADRLQGPSARHWLGTDHLGRDLFSRLMHGTRMSLGSVLMSLLGILAIAVPVGAAAGYLGGRVDQALMRICDGMMTFPTVVLALFLIGALGTGLANVVVAIAVSHFPFYARIVRAVVLTLRNADFVLAARLSGAGRIRVFIDHLLPAIAAQILVLASLDVGHMMLHVSGLSFLGLGVETPTAEWGVMIADGRQFVFSQPMLIVLPGLCLLMAVMASNILGDALRDRLDPHHQFGHDH
ncbi:nickel ABC transporter permease subunit NikC [Rhodovulum sp. BSW8]|uniref:Nickel ABC transporter permease subunit NikC n=2 Tax=Paracoccaceae TaxID=31989 RepID=A0ABS1RDY4_9RHOB|nr:nickel ABC transporter permease subunit NikC [Rhodovulum visakhapatnamense]MBL3569741.1 nickel ABC transporter permease subunit NikC [Rhodovulum visakhapatnamense]MBL3577823.1 nickel ABC transporter permease subunit NikC [Rhodovulum visakhapatnamense]OLS42408.1 nickel ABC transporter permease subunit NikC [Rhodovulum sulfidophilum]RBO53910.1 nickel ABC transporter permease subunit NikC [Rhodovulum sp. BSW8]